MLAYEMFRLYDRGCGIHRSGMENGLMGVCTEDSIVKFI